jgi:hypothetical protein
MLKCRGFECVLLFFFFFPLFSLCFCYEGKVGGEGGKVSRETVGCYCCCCCCRDGFLFFHFCSSFDVDTFFFGTH